MPQSESAINLGTCVTLVNAFHSQNATEYYKSYRAKNTRERARKNAILVKLCSTVVRKIENTNVQPTYTKCSRIDGTTVCKI